MLVLKVQYFDIFSTLQNTNKWLKYLVAHMERFPAQPRGNFLEAIKYVAEHVREALHRQKFWQNGPVGDVHHSKVILVD